jgi:glycosyltransferase involved in cell wall biosynthesis
MMKTSLLSLVTITKNDSVGLARTLASARAIRAGGAEHLVIDGGSNLDATRQAVFKAGDDSVVIAHPPKGISDAFNAGLRAARGEWIWFLNGGDAVHESLNPAWLLELLATSRAKIIVGGIHYDGDAAPRFAPHLSKQWPLLSCWLPHPAAIVRRDALIKAGGFDEGLAVAADYALWFRLLGDTMAPDLISIPFTRFDVNGLSQREDSRHIAHAEEARILLKQKGHLLREGIRSLGRILYRLLWAIRHR